MRFARLSRGKAGTGLSEIMLESNGWGGTAFRRKAIPRWKRVLESNPRMGTVRLLRACVVALAFLAAAISARPALAQANFDRPGGDYLSAPVTSGDPAECALVCERDRRCRAWTFSYPTDLANRAVCWLKSNVPARVQSDCCVTGVRGAGVVERRNETSETSIDRLGGVCRNYLTTPEVNPAFRRGGLMSFFRKQCASVPA